MDEIHRRAQERHNSRIRERDSYQIGDLVMRARPMQVGGNKLNHFWDGPCRVLSRTGGSIYAISTPEGGALDVHHSQLKLYHGDPLLPGGVPLHHYQSGNKPPAPTPKVGFIMDHNSNREPWRFLVRWQGADPSEDSWVSTPELLTIARPLLTSYLASKGLLGELVQQFQPSSSSEDEA